MVDSASVWWIDTADHLGAWLRQVHDVNRIAVDVESNGMFAYQPDVCTIQFAWELPDGSTRAAIVDTLAIPLPALSSLLGDPFRLKVIHDLAFDARILNTRGIVLRSVRDTSVAATYLRKPGSGLASLLAAEFGIQVSKEKQNSDWSQRPLSTESLAYLADDVYHLLRLDTRLDQQVQQAGIADEVATETAYRLMNALEESAPPSAPHLRIRGAERLGGVQTRILEAIAAAWETWAMEKNLPPQRLLADKLLLSMAQHPPRSMANLMRVGLVRKLTEKQRTELLQAILFAEQDAKDHPEQFRKPVAPPMLPVAQRIANKNLEKRLQTWRSAEAERRDVHEQVVLPTHCIRWLLSRKPTTEEQIASMPGLGKARAQRYAGRLLSLVTGE
ncbi:MAG TPA: HRDC domain-containing protein [Polyangiaceae bacterium]|nr:HRDC domain-containing protein [Polyangiaceae bacterium]